MSNDEAKVDASATAESTASSWDLICKISPYLDLHMMFPLLEFVNSCYYSLTSATSKEVAQARLALLRPTCMVDYAMDIYRELHQCEEVPQEMEDQKVQVYKRLEALRTGCQPLIDLCTESAMEPDRKKMMESRQWNLTGFSDRGIPSDMVENYREFIKVTYDCGDYLAARGMIQMYISFFALPPPTTTEQQQQSKEQPQENEEAAMVDSSTSSAAAAAAAPIMVGNPKVYYLPSPLSKHAQLLEVLWGKLSCEILLGDWGSAIVALEAVKIGLEELAMSHAISPLDALIQRTWLLHWSLFIFWRVPTGTATATVSSSAKQPHSTFTNSLEQMVDLFTTDKYLQAITTNAPHLLRYLTVAALLSKRRGSTNSSSGSKSIHKRDNSKLHEVVSIMQHCDYTDPMVEFVDCLCLKFDFELAQKKLVQCQELLENDFFLCHQANRIMEEARVLVFENYCRIHHKVDLLTLSTKLALSPLQAEHWIVDLIRTTSSLEDAKIDSEQGCVVMGGGGVGSSTTSSNSTVYEVIMERTRDFHLRSFTLMQNYQALLQDIRKEKARRQRAALEEDYD